MSDYQKIFDALELTKQSKESIRQSINDKGQMVDEAEKLSKYWEYILAIEGGEKDVVSIVGNYSYPKYTAAGEPTGNKIYVVPYEDSVVPPGWNRITTTLQEALEIAVSGDVIYVLQGTYPLAADVILKPGISIYGGFSETGLWEDRNPFVYPSFFDANNGAFRFVNEEDFIETQYLDGIAVSRHYSTESNGAIYSTGSINLRNCICIECSSLKGGFYVNIDGKVLNIENCIAINCTCFPTMFSATSGSAYGGGFSISYTNSKVIIKDSVAIGCKILSETDSIIGNGGGFYLNEGSYSTNLGLNFENNLAINCGTGSAANNNGGGFFVNVRNGFGIMKNCTAINCFSGAGAGIYFDTYVNMYESNVSIEDCTIINCTAFSRSCFEAYSYGNVYDVNLKIKNCTAINCKTDSFGGSYDSQSSSAFFAYYTSASGTIDAISFEECMAINCFSFSDRKGASGFYGRGGMFKNCIAINCQNKLEGAAFIGVVSSHFHSFFNCAAVNCKSPTGGGFYIGNSSNSNTICLYNCVAWNCYSDDTLNGFYINPSSSLRLKVYNCASDAIIILNGTSSNLDIKNFKLLTEFPFTNEALEPMDIVGTLDFETEPSNNANNTIIPIEKTITDNIPDLHITSDSALVGAGYYESGITPTTDFDGNERPYPPSIGPYDIAPAPGTYYNWIKTTKEGDFSLSLIADSIFDFFIDWGDGKVEMLPCTTASKTFVHTYSDSIEKTIRILSKDTGKLKSLVCNSNQITMLDVTKNIALTTLRCQLNLISTLDVTKNVLLTNLQVYSNKITELDVSKCTLLTVLWCYLNQLTTLDITYNTALTNLRCISNKLTVLNIQNNPLLIDLQCQTNQLTVAVINTLLANLVAFNKTTGIFSAAQNPAAAPTGQGLTDKQTLIDRGWTVTTN